MNKTVFLIFCLYFMSACGPASIANNNNNSVSLNISETLISDAIKKVLKNEMKPDQNPNKPAVNLEAPTPVFYAPEPLNLLPDGSASAAPTPIPTPTAVPTPSPVPLPDPSASPSPEPAYDPILDEATDAQLLLVRQGDNLRLTFTLIQANGLPVNWNKGTVQIEYYLANGDGSFLTSGRTVITANRDGFVVSLGTRQASEMIIADYVLTLPNLSQIKKKETRSL